ncbi:DUF3500 domain-containing protein [Paramicrobacterium chengjingii]|uniref:DUF3500 domain-containing protein n=1 Tax=Paramicrobacterium chengjingii TaxID=2769067 RepID=UPI001AB0373D|nr:DUF3500 domain-containing protein [Microbacterium chengjingii]
MSLSDEDIDDSFSTARVTGRSDDITLSAESYREFLYDAADPLLADARGLNYDEFAAEKKKSPFLRELLEYWNGLYREPFVGMTTDGHVKAGNYALPAHLEPNSEAMVTAAYRVLSTLSDDERRAFQYSLDAPEWRAWSNPEFVIHRVGLRLEELTEGAVSAFFDLMRESLSPAGYDRVVDAMELNGFLGELTGLPCILNSRSYWVSLYGNPSTSEPWGWQLFGHHVALNVVMVGGRQVIAPVFLGAEPASSEGSRPTLFETRERLALELGSSFTAEQRVKAIVYGSVLDPTMPEGRLHPADERHVAGAFRDNRVVPYEGINARELGDAQRRTLVEIVEDVLLLLPETERRRTMREVGACVGETWISWYGATDGSQPFYLRIQSPVIMTEMDHHAGVWLNNRLPERFHVHTTFRLPNGNDYARAYIGEWRARTGV